MRILVTGSTGHLGSALLNQLKGSDYKVKITSRNKPKGNEHFEWIYSDLFSGEGLEEAVKEMWMLLFTQLQVRISIQRLLRFQVLMSY
ncbi:NAD-dependent epimerase/dehydratase family protein [Metabacillus litoralis]|uniref:NAD-dependent epimerase/dehydratase family protein n=1 Tax=Metabacillus litoralis TaxID=152268 RepID=UPI001E4E48A7|nr:NAD-dependent epimerase/dehydratase family protein [Metabacillus litoralis]UHA58702.1 NAD-dependent epimerase/dehydratase family protein [Metabacillus litoralis]